MCNAQKKIGQEFPPICTESHFTWSLNQQDRHNKFFLLILNNGFFQRPSANSHKTLGQFQVKQMMIKHALHKRNKQLKYKVRPLCTCVRYKAREVCLQIP